MKNLNVEDDRSHLDDDYEERQRQPLSFVALVTALLVGTLTALLALTSGYSLVMSILYFSLSGQFAFVAVLTSLVLADSLRNSWSKRWRVLRRLRDKQTSKSR